MWRKIRRYRQHKFLRMDPTPEFIAHISIVPDSNPLSSSHCKIKITFVRYSGKTVVWNEKRRIGLFKHLSNYTNWKHNIYLLHISKWFVLLTQYCAGDKIEKNEMGWAYGAYGWGEGVYRVLLGKPEGKRPLGRPRRRWVVRMDLQEVGCGCMDWIGLTQDRDRWRTLVSAVMNLRAPWNAGNFLTNCKPVSFSRRTLHHGIRSK